MLGDPARAPPEFLIMQTTSQPETQGEGQWPIEMYRPILLPITHLGTASTILRLLTVEKTPPSVLPSESDAQVLVALARRDDVMARKNAAMCGVDFRAAADCH